MSSRAGDWPLIGFTLLAQAGAGLTWVALVEGWLGGSSTILPRVTALVLIGLALALSLAHLTKPRSAPTALRNLRGSPLSREVALVAALAGGVGWLVFLDLAGVESGRGYWEAGVFCLAGAALGAMVRVYLLPAVPGWHNPATPLEFIGSALVPGGGLGLAALGPESTVALISLGLGLVLKLAAIPPALKAERAVRGRTFSRSPESGLPPGFFRTIRLGSYLAGSALILIGLNARDLFPFLSISGLVCLTIGEIIGRYRFYGSSARLGL